MTTISADILIK